jgi:hypothetical protein
LSRQPAIRAKIVVDAMQEAGQNMSALLKAYSGKVEYDENNLAK